MRTAPRVTALSRDTRLTVGTERVNAVLELVVHCVCEVSQPLWTVHQFVQPGGAPPAMCPQFKLSVAVLLAYP